MEYDLAFAGTVLNPFPWSTGPPVMWSTGALQRASLFSVEQGCLFMSIYLCQVSFVCGSWVCGRSLARPSNFVMGVHLEMQL